MEAIIIIGVLYALWLLFILAMGFRRAWPGLGLLARILALPVLVIGVALDVAVNVASTLVFFDLPRETTLSHRLKRYNKAPPARPVDRYRQRIAQWVCTNMLDKFDPDGDHC